LYIFFVFFKRGGFKKKKKQTLHYLNLHIYMYFFPLPLHYWSL